MLAGWHYAARMKFFRIYGIFIGGMGAGAMWPLSFLNGPAWLFLTCTAVGLLGAGLMLRVILFDGPSIAAADRPESEGHI
jgi:hypothetical protein